MAEDLEHSLTPPSLHDPLPTSPPGEAVLHTYELLEQILSHIPLRKLFAIQRVSHTWHNLISKSIPLRHKMFLLASSPPPQPQEINGALTYIGRPLFHPQTTVRIFHYRDSDYFHYRDSDYDVHSTSDRRGLALMRGSSRGKGMCCTSAIWR